MHYVVIVLVAECALWQGRNGPTFRGSSSEMLNCRTEGRTQSWRDRGEMRQDEPLKERRTAHSFLSPFYQNENLPGARDLVPE
jgi:hypothetical protein